jgi:hypothetical protein
MKLNQVDGCSTAMSNAPATFISAFVLQVIAASMLTGIMGPAATGREGLQLGRRCYSGHWQLQTRYREAFPPDRVNSATSIPS